MRSFEGHAGAVNAAAFSRDGMRVLSASAFVVRCPVARLPLDAFERHQRCEILLEPALQQTPLPQQRPCGFDSDLECALTTVVVFAWRPVSEPRRLSKKSLRCAVWRET